MAELHSYGLKKIEMGDVGVDGGMGATLTDVGIVYKDTCDLQQGDPTSTPHYGEASDDPFLTVDKKGLTTLKFSLVDVTPATMVKFLGGSVTTVDVKDQWNAPSSVPNIEQSFKVTTQNDVLIEIPRGKVNAKVNWKIAGSEVAKLDITVTALQPTKAGTESLIVIEP